MIRFLSMVAVFLLFAVKAEAGDCRGVLQLRAYIAAPAVQAYAQPLAVAEPQVEYNAVGVLAYTAPPVLRVEVPAVQYRYVQPLQQNQVQFRQVQKVQQVQVVEKVRVVQPIQKVVVQEKVFIQQDHHSQQFRQSRFRSRQQLNSGGGNTNIQFGLFNRAR